MEMTFGNILRMCVEENKKSTTYEKLKNKKYLKDNVRDSMRNTMLEKARQGLSTTTFEAYDIIDEKYHSIIKLDMRSNAKKTLVSEVTEFLQLEFEDVRVMWVGKSGINFAWW